MGGMAVCLAKAAPWLSSFLLSSQVGFLDLRVAPDFLRRTFGDYLTLRQYADAIGHGEDDVHIVLDNDLGHAAHLDLLKQFDGGVRIMSGHSRRRLVEEE